MMKIDFPDELTEVDVRYRPDAFRILQEGMIIEGKTSFQFLRACNEFDPSFYEWLTIMGALSEQFDAHLRTVNHTAVCISCQQTTLRDETDHWERCPEHPAGKRLRDMASRIEELEATQELMRQYRQAYNLVTQYRTSPRCSGDTLKENIREANRLCALEAASNG